MSKSKFQILSFLLLLLVLICMGNTTLYALNPSHYAKKSLMASGKWVKVSIKNEGMQFISNSQLKNWGFSDPTKVNIYGYGGRRIREALDDQHPDDLPIQPSIRTSSGLVFYAVGTTMWTETRNTVQKYTRILNNYSSESYYFLSDADVTKQEMPDIGSYGNPEDVVLTTFTQALLHEKEEFAPANTGAMLLGEDFRTNSRQNFSFTLPGHINDKISVAVAFATKTTGGSSSLSFTANGKQISKSETDNIPAIRGTLSDTHLTLANTTKEISGITDKLDFQIKLSYSGSVYLARLDNIIVNYERALKLDGSDLLFNLNTANGNVSIKVEGCSPTTQIWDVTNPANPMKVKFLLTGTTAFFNPGAKGEREYVAFEPSKITTSPVLVSEIKNQNLHELENPEMIIISLPEYKAQADRIAQMHRNNDSMTVHVVTDQEVFNEFSSGTPDIGAFRKFCKMFYDRTKESTNPFSYCLLIGRPTYDNRALTPAIKNSYNRLLIWQSESSASESSSYCTDNIIGMLDDSTDDKFNIASEKMSIAVGRFPVKNEREAKAMTDKLLKYVNEPNYGAWRNRVVVLADDGDNGVHLDQAERCIDAMSKSDNGESFLYERLYLDSYHLGVSPQGAVYPAAKERLKQIFNQGAGFIDYIGHANPMSWTHELLWTYPDIISMTNKNWPFILHASCEFIRWDSDEESGAETMWLYPDAGVIGFIAANRKVYISQNGTLNRATTSNLFNRNKQGKGLRIGDIYKEGMNGYPSSDTNKLRYCLMGDPAMRIFNPDLNIVVDKINGIEINSIKEPADYPVIQALSDVTFSGYVTTPEGNIQTNYNGTLIPELYDAEETIETFANGENGSVRVYNDRKNRLYVGKTIIENGRWELKLKLPAKITGNFTPPLLSCYAYSEDGKEANGATDKFYIYGWNNEADADIVGPEINLLTLNSKQWQPGGTVGTSPLLLAEFSDPSGINISSIGIGQRITAIIDGNKVYDDLTDYYEPSIDQSDAGSVAYPLNGLSNGEHTLKFIVWDNVGNSSAKEITFNVAESASEAKIDLYTNANPASVSVTFFVNAPTSVDATTLIEVFDLSGRKIWSRSEQGSNTSTTWDLQDGSGNRIPRGIYLYRATVSDKNGKEMKQTKKLAVTAAL